MGHHRGVPLRRLLTAPALVVALLTGAGAEDDDRAEVPAWATRAVVAEDRVEVDLAESATGADLAGYVAGLPAYVEAEFHTLNGARLRVTGTSADGALMRAVTGAWLAFAADDGSADAVLDGDGRLSFSDGSI
jgi:hypothetical protein